MNYSVTEESEKLLKKSIIENQRINVPESIKLLANKVKFEGADTPAYPINLKFAESISALKAYEGISMVDLIQKKYNVNVDQVIVNTDHAQLLLISPTCVSFVVKSEEEEEKIVTAATPLEMMKIFSQHFKNTDYYGSISPYNQTATNIYRTKDNRFFHLHGSMRAEIIQRAIGASLTPPRPNMTIQESAAYYQDIVSNFTADELNDLANNKHGQAGTICYRTEEFKETEQYKANQHVGLFETHFIEDGTPAMWWDLENAGSVKRPLAGLKVLDLTRVIAAPVITRSLAEYGASVMRITSPNLPDISALHPDMNNGKWNCELDFKRQEDCKKLLELVEEADIIVQGYRPFHLDKYGISKEDLLAIAKKRGRGIIYARENCYGWNGPWVQRTGWQQISDACCGISYKFGNAMGYDEPITPVLPNSDFCTGSAGAIAIIQALIDRSIKGGSYVIDCALNYYNMWLAEEVGTYEENMWQQLWESKGKPQLRHYDPMMASLPKYTIATKQYSSAMWNPEFFEDRELIDSESVKLRICKPVLKFSGETKLYFNIPARGNGVDAPYWPNDLAAKKVIN